MSWLLIDNSNTRTKFALGTPNQSLEWRGVLPTREISHDSLTLLLNGLSFSSVIIGSVVPEKAEILKDFFKNHPTHFLSHLSPLGFDIDYPDPSHIGADRLANAAGVIARHGAPAIVIDFGTAVTFDVISAKPAYCGGVIAPGLGAMSAYLPGKTALLPVIDLEEPPSAIGKSTTHAMQAGAVFGYRGLVKEIIANISAEMTDTPRIIATGGDAALIARGLNQIHEVDPDITINGLLHVASRLPS